MDLGKSVFTEGKTPTKTILKVSGYFLSHFKKLTKPDYR